MNNQSIDIEEEKKINALLQLVDDPDEEVFETVANELLNLGTKVLEPLELLWDVSPEAIVQKRIETIIRQINLDIQIEKWAQWKAQEGNILDALILIDQFKNPQLDIESVKKQYNKLKQDIWLELNQYLTPLEQVSVINSIFYNYYNFTGVELHHTQEEHFYLHKIFELKQGNPISLGALLSSILMELDVNLNCIQLPHQFLLAYYEIMHPFNAVQKAETVMKLSCYVDPANGNVFAQRDIDTYFKKIGEKLKEEYFLPLSNIQLAYTLIRELQFHLEDKSDFKRAEDLALIIQQVFEEES